MAAALAGVFGVGPVCVCACVCVCVCVFFLFFCFYKTTNTFTVGELLALRITEKRPVEKWLGPLPNTSIINPWGAD